MLTVIAACALALMAPAAGVAQNSAIDQYVEDVPSGSGDKTADNPGGDQGGRPKADGGSGGSGSAGSSGSGSGSGSDAGGTSGKGKDGKKGTDDDTTSGPTSERVSGGSDSAAELARANVPASVGTTDGGAFPFVALLVLTALAVAAGAGWWQYSRRRGSPGGSADA